MTLPRQPAAAGTLPQWFVDRVDDAPDDALYHWREGGSWHRATAREAIDDTARLAAWLHGLGVGPGVAVAVALPTRPEWLLLDLAILSLGGVTVGLDPELGPAGLAARLERTGTRLAVVGDPALAAALASASPEVRVETLREVGRVLDTTPSKETWLRARVAEGAVEAPACWTVSDAAVTVATHGALAAAATPAAGAEERILWVVPAWEVDARCAVYRGLLGGGTGWFADPEDLAEALRVARPTAVTAGPEVLLGLRARAEAAIRDRGALARAGFRVGVRLARSRAHPSGGPTRRRDRWASAAADRLLGGVRGWLGGALRRVECVGAPIDAGLARWWRALGIEVVGPNDA